MPSGVYPHRKKLTDEERKANIKANLKKYQSRPEVKAKAEARRKRPENKAKQKEYQSRPENKAKAKERSRKPEYKEQRQKYNLRPESKVKKKERRQKPENRIKGRAYRRKYTSKLRLKTLQYYSKQLSKSDIPCCNCCGENSHIEFLALDHIGGKRQMDSESELVKLGYSSKFKSAQLTAWIIRNNFPDGFQILCHNCNSAKGFYGKCPHETAHEEETSTKTQEIDLDDLMRTGIN